MFLKKTKLKNDEKQFPWKFIVKKNESKEISVAFVLKALKKTNKQKIVKGHGLAPEDENQSLRMANNLLLLVFK